MKWYYITGIIIASIFAMPFVYAAVEPHIEINLDNGQTTDPFVIINFAGSDIFKIDSSGYFWAESLNVTSTGIESNADAVINLAADGNWIFDTRDAPRTITNGIVKIFQEPAIDGTVGLDIITDTNAHGDTKALEIDYTTTGAIAGDEDVVLDINIDRADSTGGNVFGVLVGTEGAGVSEIYALGVLAETNVIIQEAGDFDNLDSAWHNTDDILAATMSSTNNTAIFTNDNDVLYVGDTLLFSEIEFIFNVTSSAPGIGATFEYSTGTSTFASFSPIDNTNNMRQNGDVAWIPSSLTGWAVGTVNGDAGKYWIKITRTQNSLVTTPIESIIELVEPEEYYWDRDGIVRMNYLNLFLSTDAGRPTCNAGLESAIIYNSDDGQLNICDGTNWTLPDGTIT